MRHLLRKLWNGLRHVTGDDAYERYLMHQQTAHAEETPLSRKAFYRRECDRRYNGVRRCC